MESENRVQLAHEMLNFVQSFASTQLATSDCRNIPEASYAPFILDKGHFYFYLSHLAKHSRNLIDNPNLSLLFIESETQSENIFARKRTSIQCEVSIIERDCDQWQQILDKMQHKHGETVQMIRTLSDFQLFCCRPVKINFVKGFAQAYGFSVETWQKVVN